MIKLYDKTNLTFTYALQVTDGFRINMDIQIG